MRSLYFMLVMCRILVPLAGQEAAASSQLLRQPVSDADTQAVVVISSVDTAKSQQQAGLPVGEPVDQANGAEVSGRTAVGQGIRLESRVNRIHGEEGQVLLLRCRHRIKSVEDFENDVISVEVIQGDPTAVRVALKQEGVTTFLVTDETGKALQVNAIVTARDRGLRLLLDRLYPDSVLDAVSIKGAVLLRGTVENAEISKQIVEIAQQFYPSILNQLQVVDPETGGSPTAHERQPLASGTKYRRHYSIGTTESTLHVKAERTVTLQFPVAVENIVSTDTLNEIAEVLENDPTSVRIRPHQGVTRLWIAAAAENEYSVTIYAEEDVTHLEHIVENLYPRLELSIIPVNGAILLRGIVHTDQEAAQVVEIAEQFYPTVLNHLEVRHEPRNDDASDGVNDPNRPGPLSLGSGRHESIESFRREVRDLHKEVRKLVELLNEREAARARDDAAADVNAAAIVPGTRLLFFTASYCGPCRKIEPLITELEGEFSLIERIRIQRQPELTRQYKVHSIPTFIMVRDGKEVERHVGSLTREQLREMLLQCCPDEKLFETNATRTRQRRSGFTARRPTIGQLTFAIRRNAWHAFLNVSQQGALLALDFWGIQ